ncbi:Ribonuclease H-like superfamily protein [Striga hermonthica]|uniref:Ribonuclease H-like superfamily protein n=1 Tax=Striga hermonthica TaxID=68872 RepID=A0A9N7QZF1_STRHE|nr:Ribonuclease H-like superfamily protein [Striga hermonthica]
MKKAEVTIMTATEHRIELRRRWTQVKRGIHWVAWNKVTVPKSSGGLGFKDVKVFNDSLILKQLWKLLTKPNSLMIRVLKKRYFPSGCVLVAKKSSAASWLWNSWVTVLNMHKDGFRREVKDGINTKILSHPWVAGLSIGKPSLRAEVNDFSLTWVKELLSDDGRSWNVDLVRELFTPKSCKAILHIRNLNPTEKDRWVWKADSKGKFSLALAYSVAREELECRSCEGALYS